ncbi:TPA: 2Fe-2S iron-sulfur cluster-binding protein, partial [Klebsiella pneumoniae]
MSANFNCQIVSTEQSEAVITGEDAVTTILEQLESAGIQVESQCRSGYCGACRLKKKSGEVKYDNDPLDYV